MSGPMIRSKEFPNILIEESIYPAVENVLRKVKDSPDSTVQAAIRDTAHLPDYNFRDGSAESNCIGSHTASTKTIYLPAKLNGQYIDTYGHPQRMTLEGQISHEYFGHALQHHYPYGEANLDAAVKGNLSRLMSEHAGNTKGLGVRSTPMQIADANPSFPTRIAAEVSAIEAENQMMMRLNLRSIPRSNVTDNNTPNFTIDNMREWYSKRYEVRGSCTNGTSLGIETSDSEAIKTAQSAQEKINSVLALHPDSVVEYQAAKKHIEGQVTDMPDKAKNVVMAEFNNRAAEMLAAQRGQEMA